MSPPELGITKPALEYTSPARPSWGKRSWPVALRWSRAEETGEVGLSLEMGEVGSAPTGYAFRPGVPGSLVGDQGIASMANYTTSAATASFRLGS
jgi:hypothetical protein